MICVASGISGCSASSESIKLKRFEDVGPLDERVVLGRQWRNYVLCAAVSATTSTVSCRSIFSTTQKSLRFLIVLHRPRLSEAVCDENCARSTRIDPYGHCILSAKTSWVLMSRATNGESSGGASPNHPPVFGPAVQRPTLLESTTVSIRRSPTRSRSIGDPTLPLLKYRYFPSCDHRGQLTAQSQGFVQVWVLVSNSIKFSDGHTVPEMYLPSGDQCGEKSPLEPGNVETRLELRSRM